MAKWVHVPVKILKEPTNPADATAIAFICCADKRIGYVITEALDDVNSAMDENKIINIYLIGLDDPSGSKFQDGMLE